MDERAVWVVTGASRGIGAAIANRAGGLGARVVLFARDEESLAAVAQSVEGAGGEALVVAGDARSFEDIERLFERALGHWSKVDCLVNCAGRGIYSLVGDGRREDWTAMVELNLLGAFYASQQAVRCMRASGGGTIVNISSVGGRKGMAGWSVYNATKFGLNGFSDALRLETLQENIRVIVVEPGAVDTDWGEGIPADFQRLRQSVRNLTADDIADTVVFAVTRPGHVALNEILIRPSAQER